MCVPQRYIYQANQRKLRNKINKSIKKRKLQEKTILEKLEQKNKNEHSKFKKLLNQYEKIKNDIDSIIKKYSKKNK